MTDPAIEAAQRAWDAVTFGEPFDGFVAAAREALKPIRELHQTITDPIWWHKLHPDDPDEYTHCRCQVAATGYQLWPCATAKLIYTTEELDQ